MSISKIYTALRDHGALSWPFVLFAAACFVGVDALTLWAGFHEPDGAGAIGIFILSLILAFYVIVLNIDMALRRQRESEMWAQYYAGREEVIANLDANPDTTPTSRHLALVRYDRFHKPFYI